MHAVLFIWLAPSFQAAVPVAYFETLSGCVAALPVAEAEYVQEGWGNAQAVCVEFSFAPETSPRPQPKPERNQ